MGKLTIQQGFTRRSMYLQRRTTNERSIFLLTVLQFVFEFLSVYTVHF